MRWDCKLVLRCISPVLWIGKAICFISFANCNVVTPSLAVLRAEWWLIKFAFLNFLEIFSWKSDLSSIICLKHCPFNCRLLLTLSHKNVEYLTHAGIPTQMTGCVCERMGCVKGIRDLKDVPLPLCGYWYWCTFLDCGFVAPVNIVMCGSKVEVLFLR